MSEPIELQEFTFENLKSYLFDKVISKQQLEGKGHVLYLNDYLVQIGAKTIIAEREYVDRDFLEDYSAYYVRCFTPIERLCIRLHFFSMPITKSDFEDVLQKNNLEKMKSFQENYLGFIVTKPLPQTIIGRTCLATYGSDGDRRHFPINRKYEVCLAGIPLEVSSLAYQEQDRVVAACATSALWSVLHSTGKLFQHAIPSPVEITKAATHQLPVQSRYFPNNGLTGYQIAQAVRSVGLEPYYTAFP